MKNPDCQATIMIAALAGTIAYVITASLKAVAACSELCPSHPANTEAKICGR